MSELEAELTAVRAELEEHLLPAEPLEAAAPAPESDGLKWVVGSQRALSAALVGVTEWRSVLNHAVDTLGSEEDGMRRSRGTPTSRMVDEVRRDLTRDPHAWYAQDPDLAARRGCGDGRVRSCSQPDGDDLLLFN